MLTVGIYGIPDTSGFSGSPAYSHDHSLTLMREGRVLSYIQLERYTQKKHDNRLCDYIEEILSDLLSLHLRADEPLRFVMANSFLGDSFISSGGNLRIEPKKILKIEEIIAPARCSFFPDGLEKKECEAYIICHEFAHIASVLPFYRDFPNNSLLVHLDGGASVSNCSVWHYDKGKIRLLDHSWDKLKKYVNNFNANPLVRFILNHEPSDHLAIPGKLMGYSSYGNDNEYVRKWLIENNFFLDFTGEKEELLATINNKFKTKFKTYDLDKQFFKDVAFAIQREFEEKVIDYLSVWQEKCSAENLVYSGGSALNIILNSKIQRSGRFKKICIPPAVSDCGLSLGAASYLEWREHGSIKKHSPFLNNYPDNSKDNKPFLNPQEIGDLIYQNKVIGLFIGNSETGPRALGHRSIIGRPDNYELRIKISESIKGREWYRPVAPVMTEKIAKKVLVEDIKEDNLCRFMLGAYNVKEGYQDKLSGVIHADNTVRAQIIYKNDSDTELLYRILEYLEQKYEIFALINTSFNIRGRPIIQRPEDAPSLAEKMGLDGIIINGNTYILHNTYLKSEFKPQK
ncbi:carbamoyltransferase C-terminal domain-containing protein [Methanoplanus limicola]|uniref:Carbamoyltransferase n=1 Tax=Methanoplanus limicola DSM 2279 TaxID=937775 RepID=H1Z057_9EURY|nr:carbamoyltransferase C-terminal domain-containing protein [Methanoplanus limicola]EHQ36149.1 Carbamoyltransferase [Methanoplanus limicola DSM 2279]